MTIRTAVLGFGVAGRIFHAPFLEHESAYSLDFVVTGNADRAAQAAAEYPNATVLPDAAALFARADEVDLVVVGTPPGTHAELAAAALDHGLHVVVDKPFVPSAAQGAALVERARQAGR